MPGVLSLGIEFGGQGIISSSGLSVVNKKLL
jgi:hypothetical protein